MSQSAATRGVDHVGLTVQDLSAAVGFFEEALGFEKIGERPSYPAAFVSDGTVMVTLWQQRTDAQGADFDRFHNLGLHHLALRVPTLVDLHALHARLEARADVTVEFAPEFLGDGPATHMMCAGPSGIRLEFITRP